MEKAHNKKDVLEREREKLYQIIFNNKAAAETNEDEIIKQSHKVDRLILKAQEVLWKAYKYRIRHRKGGVR